MQISISVKPLVSVLMSVYNGERFLREAMDSILNQTFTDFELVVFDDCSRDGSLAILQSYTDSRLRIVINEQNLGLTKTLNRGLALARGEYIARMDDDDIALPSRFERQVCFLDQNPSVAVVGTWASVVDESGVQRYSWEPPTSNEEIQSGLPRGSCIVHPSVMCRKEAVERVGGYNEEFRFAQDYDLWLRLSEKYELANIPQHLLMYRVHSGQASVSKIRAQRESVNRARQMAAKRRAASGVLDTSAWGRAGLRARLTGVRGTLGGDYFSWSHQYFHMGDRRQAARLVGRALVESPLSGDAWDMGWRLLFAWGGLPDNGKALRWCAYRIKCLLTGTRPK